jgi:hypothetical protein
MTKNVRDLLERIAVAIESLPKSDSDNPLKHDGRLDRNEKIPTQTKRGNTPYLNSREAADYLGIKVKSLYGIVVRGQIVQRRWRITVSQSEVCENFFQNVMVQEILRQQWPKNTR